MMRKPLRSETITVRVPSEWAGLDSQMVRAWLGDYLRNPTLLPPDPGGDGARLSIRFPRGPVYMLADLHREKVSVALRRLIASRIAALPAPAVAVLPAPIPVPLARLSARAEVPSLLPGHVEPLREPVFRFRDDLAMSYTEQLERSRAKQREQVGQLFAGIRGERPPSGLPAARRVRSGRRVLGFLMLAGLAAVPILAMVLFSTLSGGPGPSAGASGPAFAPWVPVE